MLIKKLILGRLETNCYLVAPGVGGPAAVIDPGAEADKIIAALNQYELQVSHIINTHGHCDHIGADKEVAAYCGADIYIHVSDAEMLKDSRSNLSYFFGGDYKLDIKVKLIAEDEEIIIGDLNLRVLHTPGHTPGGITLAAPGALFVGDLIFAGSVGRTDLGGGNQQTLLASIRDKILSFPDETVIYPGHGGTTTVGIEKISNPYLQFKI